MGKQGRKPQAGERYPSGKLKKRVSLTKPTSEPVTGTMQQRWRQNYQRMGIDPRFLTELGRLNCDAELTAVQVAAGHEIASIYGRYEGLNGFQRSARSPSYNASFGEAQVHDDLVDPEIIEAREKYAAKVRDDFLHLSSFMAVIPQRLREAVEELCVEDLHVLPSMYEDIRAFLNRIGKVLADWRKRKGTPRVPATAARARLAEAAGPKRPTPKPVRKVNVERTAFVKLLRQARPDLEHDEVAGAYDLFRALKDQTAHNAKTDRIRQTGDYAKTPHPSTLTSTTVNRPALTLPGKEST